MAERKKRKKSIFIRDIRTVGRGLKEEVKGILKKYLGLDVYINNIRAIRGEGSNRTCSDGKQDRNYEKKGDLKGMGIWLDDDLTKGKNRYKTGWKV